MKLGNIEVEFSFSNTSNLRKLQNAYQKVLEKDNKSKEKEMSFIEEMDTQCNIAREFFNEVFGEENDYEKIMDTLEDVIKEYEKQQSRLNEKFAKYSPSRIKKKGTK